MSHTLIVETDPDDDQSVIGHVVCSGVTESCRTWWECREEHEWDREAYESLSDAVYEGDDLYHGVEHRVIDYMVMTPSDQCLANTMDGAVDSAYDAAQGLAPGEYPCDVTYEGEELVLVSIIQQAAPVPTDRETGES